MDSDFVQKLWFFCPLLMLCVFLVMEVSSLCVLRYRDFVFAIHFLAQIFAPSPPQSNRPKVVSGLHSGSLADQFLAPQQNPEILVDNSLFLASCHLNWFRVIVIWFCNFRHQTRTRKILHLWFPCNLLLFHWFWQFSARTKNTNDI